MKKALVIDDDVDILYLIKDILEDDGYEVVISNSAEEAYIKLNDDIDIVLLDVMMPGTDGFSFCKKIRDEVEIPIIFLTAKTSEEDIIKGLALGGDDYITKPFSINQLRARMNAHIRRDNRKKEKNYLMIGDIKMNLKSREVEYFGEDIVFTKREFDILELLALNIGMVFSKEDIYEKVWGYDAEGDSATVSEHIKKIRAKFLKINKEFDSIQTVWGIGYKFKK
ncbi:MAG: response regulator transcription factor [Intestinibacter sp.]|uniref:response regulator transcription factor n=1 Tax=Intestinibacter sp. TaxID=1965304 RepID=UPI0025C203D4|nr:response regulator transcription factor [Intestinibacter sp.]MCI6737380.1 response regulator transcription factor [Intestinibacter sp.]